MVKAPAEPTPPQTVGPGVWKSGLFDCVADLSNCCITCCLPCITFGQIAEILDEKENSCIICGILYGLIAPVCCAWICTSKYRAKLRDKYNLPVDPFSDCCVHFWCDMCALCQEYRELQGRGYDMSLGWHGSNKALAPPQVATGMRR